MTVMTKSAPFLPAIPRRAETLQFQRPLRMAEAAEAPSAQPGILGVAVRRDALLRDGVQRKRTDKLPRLRIRFVHFASHFLSVQPCTKGAAVTAQFAFGGSSSKSFKRSRGKRSWFELLRNDWRIATKETPLDHRSTSPKTISSEPKIALTSASIDLRQRKSIAARCAKPGALILQR